MGGQKRYFPPKWSGRSSHNTQFKKYDSRNKYLKIRDRLFFLGMGTCHTFCIIHFVMTDIISNFSLQSNLNQQIKVLGFIELHPKLHAGFWKQSWN